MDSATANLWINAHFAPCLRALAPRVERMACTGAELTLPITAELVVPGGTVAPQALTALADTAMAIACAGHFRAFRPLNRANFDVQFLRPASGESLSCTATVVRASKALIFTRAVLTAEPSGKEVATATATWAVP
ncbi:MAG: hypothetical protein AUK37_06155 [Rhodobacterales bacterium CG2_30_65_12]|nr:MAG: hypothetical protein AUK37_06155 [Rhodobacterales bacterium CG2_30_65_12]